MSDTSTDYGDIILDLRDAPPSGKPIWLSNYGRYSYPLNRKNFGDDINISAGKVDGAKAILATVGK